MAKVTSAQFMKTPGVYQDQAQREPVVITKHNREHTVLLSAEEYHRLKRRDREVFRVGELSDTDIAAITAAEPPEEAKEFDRERMESFTARAAALRRRLHSNIDSTEIIRADRDRDHSWLPAKTSTPAWR